MRLPRFRTKGVRDMEKNRKPVAFIVGLIVVLIIGAAVFASMRGNDSKNDDMSGMDTQNQSQSDSSSDSADAVEANAVTIKNFKFAPSDIKVKVGTTVTWTNQDGVKHNVMTEDGAPEKIEGELIAKGETFSYTFKKAGTYDYFCQPHPYMKGTVTVTE